MFNTNLAGWFLNESAAIQTCSFSTGAAEVARRELQALVTREAEGFLGEPLKGRRGVAPTAILVVRGIHFLSNVRGHLKFARGRIRYR